MARDAHSLQAALAQSQRPLLLDGATGTELQRRGMELRVPLWSAQALLDRPELLLAIHRDYVLAGAELLTANTFRTHGRNLAAGGLADRAAELTAQAVQLARQAAEGRAWVLGSQAPLEDCYRPDLVPPEEQLREEHARMAQHLLQAGADGILVETHNTLREARAAAQAALATGLPVLVSFVCDHQGRLLSGEPLEQAAAEVLALGVSALMVNCVPAPWVNGCLTVLDQVARGRVPWGAYANTGQPDAEGRWHDTDARDPARYAQYAQVWLAHGARLLGGCCGTTPEHIRQLRRLLDLGSEPVGSAPADA